MRLRAIWQVSNDVESRWYLDLACSVGVILLLIALALPVYKEYVVKARVAQVYYFILDLKNYVHEFYGTKYQLPTNENLGSYISSYDFSSVEGSPDTMKYQVRYRDEQYVITLQGQIPELHNKTLSLRPIIALDKGTIIWLCGYDKSLNETTLRYSNLTTLPENYLTGICKDQGYDQR